MTSNQRIITYFQLNERERRSRFAGSGTDAFLKDKQFAVGSAHLVVLEDGRAIAMGSNRYGQCGVDGWSDLVKVAAGDYHTVGLRRDGTVLAAGDNSSGQCSVAHWRDVVDIFADRELTIGVKADGTVMASGGQEALQEAHTDPPIPGEQEEEPSPLRDLLTAYAQDVTLCADAGANGILCTADRDSVSVTGYKGSESTLVIPERIDGLPVRIIAPKAFEDSAVEKVVLPGTLQFIGPSAFLSCKALKNIIIPDSVRHIDNYAFWLCSSLRNAVLPDKIQYMGKNAFSQCPALQNVFITEAAKKRLGLWTLKRAVDDAAVYTEYEPE